MDGFNTSSRQRSNSQRRGSRLEDIFPEIRDQMEASRRESRLEPKEDSSRLFPSHSVQGLVQEGRNSSENQTEDGTSREFSSPLKDERESGLDTPIRREAEEGQNGTATTARNRMDRSSNHSSLGRMIEPPELVHQVSVLDFVRVESPRGTNKPKYCQFFVRKRLLWLLVLLGIIAGPVDLLIRECIELIFKGRGRVTDYADNYFAAYAIWTCTSLVLVLSAVLLTTWIEPLASGSGLPEIKTILAGNNIIGYLTIRAFFVKVFGLIAGASSGLSIGREGPFVHITCIIAHELMRLPFFKQFSTRKSHRLQILAAAAAVGVAANFSAPLGGVLFSLEVTAVYYLLDNYWKSFLSAISAAVMAGLLRAFVGQSKDFTQIFQTAYPQSPYVVQELPFYLLLGLFMGVLGGVLVHMYTYVKKLLSRKVTKRRELFFKKWILPALVAIATSSITYFAGDFMRCSLSECVGQLLSEKELDKDWINSVFGLNGSLLFFAVSYFLLTPVSIALPIPAGAFIPSFIIGAACGRLLGNILRDSVLLSTNSVIFPGGYALVGGAALTASFTRTISTAVIALEITGQQHFFLPVFIGVLASYGTTFFVSSNGLFNTILILRGLPYLPIIQFEKHLVVGDVMNRNVLKVSRTSSFAKIILTVNLMQRRTVPVVDTIDNMLLLGAVSKDSLMRLVRAYYEKHALSNIEHDLGNPLEGNLTSNDNSYIRRSIATLRSVFDESLSTRYAQQSEPRTNAPTISSTGAPVLNNSRILELWARSGQSGDPYLPPQTSSISRDLTSFSMNGGSHCDSKSQEPARKKMGVASRINSSPEQRPAVANNTRQEASNRDDKQDTTGDREDTSKTHIRRKNHLLTNPSSSFSTTTNYDLDATHASFVESSESVASPKPEPCSQNGTRSDSALGHGRREFNAPQEGAAAGIAPAASNLRLNPPAQGERDPNNPNPFWNEEFLLRMMQEYWDSNKNLLLTREVDLIHQLGENVLAPTVLTVPSNTPLEEVHVIFSMMRCNKLYVTNRGQLIGEITSEHLIAAGKQK